MSFDDALLLLSKESDLFRKTVFAAERADRHAELERQRIAAGLETDLQRYLNHKEIRD